MPVLEVSQFSITFTRYVNGLHQQQITAARCLDLTVEEGEVTAVIGASGSGKSLLAHAVLGILPRHAHAAGTLLYKGEPLTKRRQQALRGKEIVLVPQSVTYLNPLMQVGKQVRDAAHSKRKVAVAKQRQAFAMFHLDERTERMYPFELSGGMARRVLLSTAVVADAKLIIADEPTPGLGEKEVQEALQYLRLMADNGSAVLLITHDIESALTIADKLVVFYAGTTVEIAGKEDFTGDGEQLRHPYSRALWRALPQNQFQPLDELTLRGKQSNYQLQHSAKSMAGCVFASNCPLVTEQCLVQQPQLQALRGGTVRCFHAN